MMDSAVTTSTVTEVELPELSEEYYYPVVTYGDIAERKYDLLHRHGAQEDEMHEIMVKSVMCNVSDLLETLKANRLKHFEIVQEARDGYVKKAEEALAFKLEKIREGKVIGLRIDLQPPSDHTKEYDLIIKMLELHTESEIKLNGQEVQQFVLDEWSWRSSFLMANANYSRTAMLCAEANDLDVG